jgi:hypothetical protein
MALVVLERVKLHSDSSKLARLTSSQVGVYHQLKLLTRIVYGSPVSQMSFSLMPVQPQP